MPDGALCLRRDGVFPPSETGPDGSHWFREDVAHWRAYARLAEAMLTITAALRTATQRIDPCAVLDRAGFLAPQDEPEPIWMHRAGVSTHRLAYNLDRAFSPIGPAQDRTLGEQRVWLAGFLSSYWLAPAGALPTVTWDDGAPAFGLALDQYTGLGPGAAWGDAGLAPLFAVVALQLAAQVCSRERVTTCGRCGRAFVASHPRQRYCPDCRAVAAREHKSARQRRWRERTRG